MKVAFISRATLYSSPGGDTRQLEQTALNLKNSGVEIAIYLSDQFIDYSQYDLLHFFNIIRPADIIKHIKRSKKPYVVSTIFVEYGTVKDENPGLSGILKKIFSDDGLEYIKVIARAIKNGEKVTSVEYLLWGHKRSVQFVARHAGCLLPNSESEYRRFVSKYKVDQEHVVVPNGIDENLVKRVYPENAAYKDAILCMGRIETRKNQLNLIRALKNTKYKLFIHGKASPNNIAYYEECLKEASPNILIKDWLEEEELYTAYSKAKVHVLPSYFETTGLSSLEAAVMGCNIVITDRGDTREYFGDHAWYCDPDSPQSIKAAVDAAFNAPYDTQFKEYILKHYTWEQAAIETLKAYKQVLKD